MRFSYISRYTQYISRYTIMGYLSRGPSHRQVSESRVVRRARASPSKFNLKFKTRHSGVLRRSQSLGFTLFKLLRRLPLARGLLTRTLAAARGPGTIGPRTGRARTEPGGRARVTRTHSDRLGGPTRTVAARAIRPARAHTVTGTVVGRPGETVSHAGGHAGQ